MVREMELVNFVELNNHIKDSLLMISITEKVHFLSTKKLEKVSLIVEYFFIELNFYTED
jgi:hypothetical protein